MIWRIRIYGVWLLITGLSSLGAGCAISDLGTKADEENVASKAEDSPSHFVFVERGKAGGRNVGGIEKNVPIVISPNAEQEEILQLMRYSRIMHSYPKSKIKEEFKRLANEMNNDPVTASKIQMAILLSIPSTSFVNEKQAAQLLTDVVNDVDQPSSAIQEYAYLLLETVQQRNDIQKQQNELMSELQKERQKRAQLQDQLNALKEQLNALKSIEKSISQRQHNTETPTEAEAQ